jgi:hypothetical protein
MGITSIQYLHQPSTWPMAPTLANMQQVPAITQKAPTTTATTFACQLVASSTMQYQQMSLHARPTSPSSSIMPQPPLENPLMLVQ